MTGHSPNPLLFIIPPSSSFIDWLHVWPLQSTYDFDWNRCRSPRIALLDCIYAFTHWNPAFASPHPPLVRLDCWVSLPIKRPSFFFYLAHFFLIRDRTWGPDPILNQKPWSSTRLSARIKLVVCLLPPSLLPPPPTLQLWKTKPRSVSPCPLPPLPLGTPTPTPLSLGCWDWGPCALLYLRRWCTFSFITKYIS